VATVSEAARGWNPPLELSPRLWRLGVAATTIAVAVFVVVLLHRWPPHEDEALVLFVGRGSLGELFETVLGHRGGAPLHFLLGWADVRLGGGLTGLRLISGVFAAGSVPLVALLGSRLAGRAAGLVAAVLAAGSWVLLFHGIYGRMYSLFLFTSTLSYLALLAALEHGGRRRFALWGLALVAVVATHPYGALVCAAQGITVLALRQRLRPALATLGAVFVVCLPFWWADTVLKDRFAVGVGGGGRLGDPGSVVSYLLYVAGDFTSGWKPVRALALALAAIGFVLLARRSRGAVLVAAPVFLVPTIAFLAVHLGGSTSPESRHLIFALPFVATLVAVPIVRFGSVARPAALAATLVVALLVGTEVAWARHKTPPLFSGEPQARSLARERATSWIVARARPDDVLLGYEPLFLGAWQRERTLSRQVIPRADPRLAAAALRGFGRPLGHGFWVFDASDTTNIVERPTIPDRSPGPNFDVGRFGPYLVIRSRRPLVTPQAYLETAKRVLALGRELGIGDADVGLHTLLLAGERL
jgi:hypothetical protein